MAASRTRSTMSMLCGALGVLLLFKAALFGYLTRSIFNEQAFASRVAASLEEPRVNEFVGAEIADAVIAAKPDLMGLRPVLIGVGRSVVASPPFRAAVRRSARVMHRAIMTGTGKNIVLTVQDLGALVESAAETHPALAKKIPAQLSAVIGRLESLPGGAVSTRLVRLAYRMRAVTLALLLMGVARCVLSVRLAHDRRRAIMRLGLGLVGLGLLLAIIARFGGGLLGLFVHRAEFAPLVAGLGSVFLGGLMTWAVGLGFAGLVLSSAAASLLERVPLQQWGDGVWQWLTGPQPLMRMRLARGLLGAAIGAALLFWPQPSLVVMGWMAGLVVAFAGLREGFVAALHLLPQHEAAAKGAGARGRGAFVWVGAIVTILLAVTAWVVFRSSAAAEPPADVMAFNGSPLLGDRRLDQVVFPTSHNSMGGADDASWMFPNQNAGIQKQLDDGVRAFLIDVHYAVPVGDKVKTELQDEKAAMAKYEGALGPEGMAAVLRIRDRLAGEKEGPRDIYMCHGFCELGALKLVPVLHDVREFLVANPGEVLIFVIQDESVSPVDIERCFRESGLIDFVYRGPAKPPWPTLREMVETDQRVLVMAENVWQGVDWYHPAFEVLQETPYEFHDPAEFSNKPGRGGTSGSLMLLNHWIESTPMPKPSNAAIVNAHDALLARIKAFQRARGRLPNLVAVDFYGTGDLVATCQELNARPLPKQRRK